MSPVKLLQSSWAAVVTLALCMWAQIPHSQSAFEYWSKGLSGWTFAWGFEAAVLMFVVRGMHWASWTFAAFSVLINVAYYSLDGVKMWAWPNADNWINWLLSIVLPFAIAMYSHVLAHGKDDEVERLHLPVWVQLWRMKIAQKVTEWRQGKEDAGWDASALQVEDATLSPTVQEDASDLQEEPVDPKERAKQLHSEGFKLSEIAGMIGKSESTISRWVNGASKQ